MKVLFLIAVRNHGRGGHYYSLKTTVEQISQCGSASILVIGPRPSPVLCEGLNYSVNFLKYEGLLSTLRRAIAYIGEMKPDVIHAFDSTSLFFARIASFRTKIPIVFTKCGGPNPTKYFPYARTLILYSKENKLFFKNKKKYEDTKFFLIPNRVSPPKQDAIRISELKIRTRSDLPIFLRIARISKEYRHGIIQSINLIKKLNENTAKAQLMLIGSVQDKNIFAELLEHANEHIQIIADDRYTLNANELVDIADFVIGTGRGFIEASMLGKVMLSPNKNLDIPVVVTEENINLIASLNFSERPVVLESSEQVYGRIVKILNNKIEHNNTVQFLRQYIIDNYSAEHIYEKHLPVYFQAEPAELMPIDLFLHGCLAWKAFYFAKLK